MPKVLAIDYGTVRIGLAISDELRILARPIGIISQSKKAQQEILELVRKETVQLVIIGLPKNLNGSDSEMTTEVRSFAEKLFTKLDDLKIEHRFHDERLTSIMAASNILEQGLSKSKRQQKYRHDEEAARIVLQEFLDSKL
jgi:putative Holliday junction resolvase